MFSKTKYFSYCSNGIKMFYRSTNSKENRLVLYGDDISPPVRFVKMTASLLGVQLEDHHIDLIKQENRQEQFKQINPLQTVPVLKVGEDIIIDSHAISLYLCENFNGYHLLTDNPISRAKVQQLMFYNCGTLFPIDSLLFNNYFTRKWPTDVETLEKWYSALDYLEHLLSKNQWLIGDKMTLCDLCCGTTISSLNLIVPLLNKYPRVQEWLGQLRDIPCSDINTRGLHTLEQLINKMNQDIYG